MEDYARMVHPELFSGGDGELKHFVNIKYGSNSYDANYLTSNDLLSDFDFVVKLAIGEDLYKFACGEECNKVGLAIDIATLPVFEGKAIVIGGKLCAKKLIPVIIKFVVKDTGKDVIFKVGNIVLKEGTESWGWKHITKIRAGGTSHADDIKNEFNLPDNDNAVKNLIKEALENYQDKKPDPKGGWDYYYKPTGAKKYLKIVVSEDSEKGIITAHPIDVIN
ncbi:hypothetical protein Mjas_03955 [Methanothermococcus sp. Ax23]|uniref:hypothetical protein n=1 Tax=Methanothermococcus sp. Ax23 TaxID=3156486 RepID=UPI003B9DED7F